MLYNHGGMKHIVALIALLTLSSPALSLQYAATLTGIAVAKDGDGILFGDVEIRLQGISAPEFNRRKKEPGGKESLENLRGLVDGKWIRCELDGTTARQRPVAVCWVGRDRDRKATGSGWPRTRLPTLLRRTVC